MSIFDQFDQVWKMFIRPSRQNYSPFDLGPTKYYVQNDQINIKVDRIDFELKNIRNQTLKCSLYEPELQNTHKTRKLIIYLHCFNGSRIESLSYSKYFLENNIAFCSFDFAGSGLSDGKYVTLGYYEKFDIQEVVSYLRNQKGYQQIGLWGRSMGAVTSLLYAQNDLNIKVLALDSPFTDLDTLSLELAQQKSSMPAFILKGVLSLIKAKIKEKAEFQLEDVNVITDIDKLKMPALFISSKNDRLINENHTQKIFELYKGEKKLLKILNDHSERRNFQTLLDIQRFLLQKLNETDENTTVKLNKTIISPHFGDILNERCTMTQSIIFNPGKTQNAEKSVSPDQIKNARIPSPLQSYNSPKNLKDRILNGKSRQTKQFAQNIRNKFVRDDNQSFKDTLDVKYMIQTDQTRPITVNDETQQISPKYNQNVYNSFTHGIKQNKDKFEIIQSYREFSQKHRQQMKNEQQDNNLQNDNQNNNKQNMQKQVLQIDLRSSNNQSRPSQRPNNPFGKISQMHSPTHKKNISHNIDEIKKKIHIQENQSFDYQQDNSEIKKIFTSQNPNINQINNNNLGLQYIPQPVYTSKAQRKGIFENNSNNSKASQIQINQIHDNKYQYLYETQDPYENNRNRNNLSNTIFDIQQHRHSLQIYPQTFNQNQVKQKLINTNKDSPTYKLSQYISQKLENYQYKTEFGKGQETISRNGSLSPPKNIDCYVPKYTVQTQRIKNKFTMNTFESYSNFQGFNHIYDNNAKNSRQKKPEFQSQTDVKIQKTETEQVYSPRSKYMNNFYRQIPHTTQAINQNDLTTSFKNPQQKIKSKIFTDYMNNYQV